MIGMSFRAPKVIFLHGALVRVALLTFAVAGMLSMMFLLSHRRALYAWAMAAQKGAVLLWIVYALTSMVSTRLSWGEWIAWEEPRVRASVYVLWFSIACLLLVLWMSNRYLSAAINLLVAIVTWTLIQGAPIIRHPFDPIGSSGSNTYQALYWVWRRHWRCWRCCLCAGCTGGNSASVRPTKLLDSQQKQILNVIVDLFDRNQHAVERRLVSWRNRPMESNVDLLAC